MSPPFSSEPRDLPAATETFRVQRKMGLLFVSFCGLVALLNLAVYFLGPSNLETLISVFGVLLALAALGLVVVFVDRNSVRVVMVLLFLLPAGPAVLFSDLSFFGMWMFLIAATLIVKFQPFGKFQGVALVLSACYFAPWLTAQVLSKPYGAGDSVRVFGYLLFLAVAVLTLYVLFEEQIRELSRANRLKDAALARQGGELARLEPLSVLGERVAHVTRSFKNHLSQLRAIAGLLEDAQDAKRAAALLTVVTEDLNERIESILTVSRSGVDVEPETFDVTRVLEGVKFVYLSEPTFARTVWTEMSLDGPLLIRAPRWDFILMVESLCMSALDSIRARGTRGIIRITLAAGLLTISHNGRGADVCHDCSGDCLNCGAASTPEWSQAFTLCQRNRWALRVRTDGDWTIFKILLTAEPVSSEP